MDHSAAGIKADRAAVLKDCGAVYRGGGGDLPEGDFEFCVVSPSFAPEHRWLAECRRRRIPLNSEMDFGIRYWRGRILAVTGSKGKSTLVKLCSDTLNLAGQKAVAGGNYGIPLCELVLDASDAVWAVVEVSSFQMELSGNLAPDVAVVIAIYSRTTSRRHWHHGCSTAAERAAVCRQGLGHVQFYRRATGKSMVGGANIGQAALFWDSGEWCLQKRVCWAPERQLNAVGRTMLNHTPTIIGLAQPRLRRGVESLGVTVADIERAA